MKLQELLDIYRLFKSVNTHELRRVTKTDQSEIEKLVFNKVLLNMTIEFKTDGQRFTRITFKDLENITFKDLQDHFDSREAYSRYDDLYFYYFDEDSSDYRIEIPILKTKLSRNDRISTIIFEKWK